VPDSRLYKSISLELLHQWPGRIFLKLEPFPAGSPVIMIEVMSGDLREITKLSGWADELCLISVCALPILMPARSRSRSG